MYTYTDRDQQIVDDRVLQFRGQTQRFLDGKLDGEVFRQLRLRNGLYVQKKAPMLRVAIPYGIMDSRQMIKLADIADKYDRGYGHFTTRQNLQLNWPTIEETPDILAELAEVQMHSIQTSGNCIRNITTDPLAGVAADEISDPRIWCELIRQWSTLHPEFSFLPRKFKFAVTGSKTDRVAAQVHDIAIYVVTDENGQQGFKILVGGGQGRTPVIGKIIREFLPANDLISYLEAILRVYNRHGRRDNIYKARIKILVNQLGIDQFREQVEEEWSRIRESDLKLDDSQIEALSQRFREQEYLDLEPWDGLDNELRRHPIFADWYRRNTAAHRVSGYSVVFLSLKNHGQAPGDLDSQSMRAVAELSDRYSLGEIRTTYTQNLVFAHVEQRDLPALWKELVRLRLATPNIDTAADLICCPGADFCSLANATSIDVADDLLGRLKDKEKLDAIGDLRINLSGCVNACGHHHVGNIGLLGVEKNGEPFYQISIGGNAGDKTRLGSVLGPSLSKADIGGAIETVIDTYLTRRESGEEFLQTYERLGRKAFKEAVYG